MDRVAIFVDAGYLFAEGSKQLTGEPAITPRKQLDVDNGQVLKFLESLAKETSLPMLRVYWYDGLTGGEPNPQQQDMSFRESVKVRLGVVAGSGKQKGVDSLIVTDMITLSRNKAIASAILVAGDEDLRVGVQQSQEQGVHSHLVGWQRSQSYLLRQEADSLREVSKDEVERFLKIVEKIEEIDAVALRSVPGDPYRVVSAAVIERLPANVRSGLRASLAADPRTFLPREVDRTLIQTLSNTLEKRDLDAADKVKIREAFRVVILEGLE